VFARWANPWGSPCLGMTEKVTAGDAEAMAAGPTGFIDRAKSSQPRFFGRDVTGIDVEVVPRVVVDTVVTSPGTATRSEEICSSPGGLRPGMPSAAVQRAVLDAADGPGRR